MLKKILYFLVSAVTFMSLGSIIMIYAFKSDPTISLLLKWFFAGTVWTLVLERKKYFENHI